MAALTLQGCPVAELGLDFTLPGEPSVELCERGAKRDVGIDDLEEYVQAVLDLALRDGVRAQIDAFRKGFSEVLPAHHLRAFSPEELDVLFNGSRDVWERDAIVESLKFDHGYTRSSGAVGFLLSIMCEFTDAERRQFLKFVTGSPRLPVGGLARLVPRLTIVQKRPEGGTSPDAYLPSVMTCANYLKLPDYSSKEVPAPWKPGRAHARHPRTRTWLLTPSAPHRAGDARPAADGDQRGAGLLPPLVARRRRDGGKETGAEKGARNGFVVVGAGAAVATCMTGAESTRLQHRLSRVLRALLGA